MPSKTQGAKARLRETLARFASRSERIDALLTAVAHRQLEVPEDEMRAFDTRERRHLRRAVEQGERSTKHVMASLEALSEERMIGASHDILSIEFFEAGIAAARPVGLLDVGGTSFGTGILVGHGLILTNHHVIENESMAKMTELQLDFEENRLGAAKMTHVFDLDPARFFFTDEAHDITLVAVSEVGATRPLASFGWHPIIGQQGKIRLGDPVNIVHHPGGNAKSVTVHNSHFVHIEEQGDDSRYFWYSSDTEKGSSGAPVFNNRWEVVALHHGSVPQRVGADKFMSVDGDAMTEQDVLAQPERVLWIANEGIRASRIAEVVEAATFESDAKRKLRDELLKLWQQPSSGPLGRESLTTHEAPSTTRHTLHADGDNGARKLHIEISLE